jgi:hypothetical protein
MLAQPNLNGCRFLFRLNPDRVENAERTPFSNRLLSKGQGAEEQTGERHEDSDRWRHQKNNF